MDPLLKKLIAAPLADPLKIHLPMGRNPAKRGPRGEPGIAEGHLTRSQLKERKEREANEKLRKVLDYYGTTDLSPEQVAHHCGLYRQVKTGEDEEGRPIYERQLDVEKAAEELAWRRKAVK